MNPSRVTATIVYFVAIAGMPPLTANAQTITVTSPTLGQVVTVGDNVNVVFSYPGSLTMGIIQLYKGSSPVGSSWPSVTPGVSYPMSTAGFAPGTDYRAKVYDYANPSRVGWSSDFTVQDFSTPSAPTAIAATSISTNYFVANWDAVSGASSYHIDVSSDVNFSTFVAGYNNTNTSTLQGSGTMRFITGAFQAGTTYYYRLRAANPAGISTNSNIISVLLLPSTPDLEYAWSGTTSSFFARWDAVTGASEYRLDVSLASDFTSFVSGYNDAPIAGTSTTVVGLSANTIYYFRVRAHNASGSSGHSNIQSLITPTIAPTIQPVVSSTIVWNAVPGANLYNVVVTRNSTNEIIVDRLTTATSYYVTEPLICFVYYTARVYAFNSTPGVEMSFSSPSSSPRTIYPCAPSLVGIGRSAEESSLEMDSIVVHPNPSRDYLRLVLPELDQLDLSTKWSVTDKHGTVYVVPGKVESTFIELDLTALEPGFYILSIPWNSKLLRRKFFKE